MTFMVQKADLLDAIRRACAWLTDIAQVRGEPGPEEDTRGLLHRFWDGAIRGEYRVATRRWQFLCPIWHTGQAIKALVQAHALLGDPALLDAAKRSAAFILAERQADPDYDDYGLIYAYEDSVDAPNISAILEALDGLFHLSDATGDATYRNVAIDALDWVARRAYHPGTGRFRDTYHPVRRMFLALTGEPERGEAPGRPLLDDAVFLKGYEVTGDERYREIFFEVAEHLLACERPPGNWVAYRPCREDPGYIHPRMGYWWGLPMLDAWRTSGDERYLDCAVRVAEWHVRALRRDGGMFRQTYLDFNTDSFGHATSGTACAAIVMGEVDRARGNEHFRQHQERALAYCLRMQFRDPADPNLRGAILEKVLPPDGTDHSPYHVRDLGTIFFIQAAAQYLTQYAGMATAHRAERSIGAPQ